MVGTVVILLAGGAAGVVAGGAAGVVAGVELVVVVELGLVMRCARFGALVALASLIE